MSSLSQNRDAGSCIATFFVTAPAASITFGSLIIENEKEKLNIFIKICNRSQVHGSAFRVKEKGSIKDLKSSSKMLIFANNCQSGSRFCFRSDEADAFLVNTHPKCSPGTRMEP